MCVFIIISDQSLQDSGPFSPVVSKRGFGIGSIVRKAASVATVAAKQAYAAASSTGSDDEMIPLKCCLMSISLPWEYIAHDLLFKVRSLLDIVTSHYAYFTILNPIPLKIYCLCCMVTELCQVSRMSSCCRLAQSSLGQRCTTVSYFFGSI